MSRFVLKLYIVGQTPRAERAIVNLQHMCQQELGTNYDLTIIDVLEQPQVAEEERILATPTLVREQPAPRRCIIGDLSDTEKVFLLLGIKGYKNAEGGNV